MGKSFGVVVCLLLCLPAASANNAPDVYDPGPIKYLSYFESARNAGILLEEARAEYQVAVERERRDALLFDMQDKLMAKGATSMEDYRIAQREKEVAVAQVRVWRDRIDWLEHTVAFNQIGVEVSTGAPVNLDKTHAAYMGQWQAQCRVFKSEVVANEAQLALAAFRKQMVDKLYATRSISYSEVLDRDFLWKAAESRLAKSRRLDANCQTGLPSADFVKKIPRDIDPPAAAPSAPSVPGT
jgi:hypothetical protein